MKLKFCFALVFVALSLVVQADEKLATLKVGSEVYTNVTVTRVSATDVFFFHAGGMGNAKLKKLSPDLQQHFKFDPEKAKAAELKQTANQTKYHDQLVHQPAIHAPDMNRTQPTSAPATLALWRTDFPGALKQARAENKLVLLDFTGSDWCPTCIQLQHDVLSTEKFAAYAGAKLELVKLDFPRHTAQSPELARANHDLARQFLIEGYPTLILLNADGKELGRQLGGIGGGPEAVIAELEGFSRR